ncbi:class I SAM-dependent methyltransferase [Glycomyces sp. L485]|uniref:class I SAM-dependent methyltransferase n=1 Tax=Glycomyces sp. L485 TaxID=2909235 RepID=UPI001F4B39D8|nr:class I SAM-dependent methyltransferase [Glycomyces sp. L485]MCH7231935.1 class I SAM-dependent methyltransferase [Glycomyces sp. L485]
MAAGANRSPGWLDANRALWDERVPVHAASASYDLEGFIEGGDVLMDFEPGEVGDVAGRRLLQLQCHMGQEALTWARLGASRVVGLDFSEPAVKVARRLADDLGYATDRAEFVVSDVYGAVGAVPDPNYDIVYVSAGTINWLPDIRHWARVVSSLIAPGGFVYLCEFHPITHTLDDATGSRFVRDYASGLPVVREAPGTYADRSAPTVYNVATEWIHSLGDVVSALIEAGLRIEFLHEHDKTMFLQFKSFVQGEDGCFRPPPAQPRVPLLYSLKASRA